ncbi:uncharacterized protein TRUGW13939_05828 [Talaromyces rugulosus]|uniref:Major facilitator superfamily (MFS) profile domain-containing protein n=1 Tax=Talaromyces rugulosus TaxID=121627 RepID=A0A7H8QZ49_TALRU|nr:uncharacterized protein TRUGW13939_05828 [Talaromyces rugulosus]QKX58701.1 hypothetical protein TRUGW13939_05828 [Talaromyces rugulosus]
MSQATGVATRYNFQVVFFVALGSLTYGFNNSIMGTVFGLPSFFAYFDLKDGSSRQTSIEATTQGIFYAGGIIGCGVVAWLADKLGRKRSVQIITIACIVSAAIQAGSVHIAMLLVGRFFNGMGSGMINVIVPLYQSEVSPPKMRGRMVGSHGFLIVVGYALAAWTGLGCYYENNPQIQWRLCLALQIVPPLLLVLGSSWLPESPRWLLAQHRRDEALKVLNRLDDTDPLHGSREDHVRQECRLIESQLELDSRKPTNLIAVLKNASYRKRFLMGLFVQCLAQSTGVLVINNYQVILYNGLGLSGSVPLLLYGVYTTWAAFLNWAGPMIVDRVGRIRMLSVGMIGCALMVSCEAAMVAQYGGTSNEIGNGFGVLFLFLFVTFYGSCVDAISYVYCSELFPTNLRAQGVGLSVMGLFAMTLVYTQAAPVAFADVGWKYYLVFILVPAVSTPLMWFKFPETKGLSLEEIGAFFGDEIADGSDPVRHIDEKGEEGHNKGQKMDVGECDVVHDDN